LVPHLTLLLAIEHGRRRILHFNVTFHPTSDWIVQQLREAFPLPCPYRYAFKSTTLPRTPVGTLRV
jgi:hypothetical protein